MTRMEEVEMIIEAINAVRRIRVYPLVGSIVS
jgi:hypothetical protein